MVRPVGFEPTTFCSEDRRSNPLSYGRVICILAENWYNYRDEKGT